MKTSLVLPATTGFFLLAVLAHLGFFDLERLARGVRNLGILGSEMLPPDVGILPTVGAALWETVEMSFAGTLLGFLHTTYAAAADSGATSTDMTSTPVGDARSIEIQGRADQIRQMRRTSQA